jgi:hypothetical protein
MPLRSAEGAKKGIINVGIGGPAHAIQDKLPHALNHG